MDSLRAMVYTLVVMVSINSVCYMMDYVGMAYLDPYGDSDLTNDADPTGLIDSFSDTDPQFYNLAAALIGFYSLVKGLLLGFPLLLHEFGVPAFISTPLYVVFLLICYTAFSLGVIGGRNT